MYLSNNLTKQKGFRSTSLTAYEPDWAVTGVENKKSWPLPYNRTLTAVIRQGKFDLCGNFSRNIGFICIDSEASGVFVKRWDSHIILTIADALYHPLKGYSEAAQRARSRIVVNEPQSGTKGA